MGPEAQLHEHALHDLHQAEAFQRQPEALLHPQHVEQAMPHIHNEHEHHDHDHHIEIRKAHACAADCPEHGSGHHEHYDSVDHHEHSHEHAHRDEAKAHTIQRKAPEHACSADCPEHHTGHEHEAHDHHNHTESSHEEPHYIEHKSHACAADCPEHGHSNHSHGPEQEAKEQKIVLKEHHACGPDCPEYSHGAHDHHEHENEKLHTITQKTPEHACGADCPEHGRVLQHNHAHEPQLAHEKISADTQQEQAEALQVQHRIEQEVRAAQPVEQDTPDTTERPVVSRQPQVENRVHEDVADISDSYDRYPRQKEMEAARTTAETEPTDWSIEVVEVVSNSRESVQDIEVETAPFDAAAEIALPTPLPAIEHQPLLQQETIFDIPALLAEQVSNTPSSNEAPPLLHTQSESLISARLPELPDSPEPLLIAAVTIAQAVTERYQSIAESTDAEALPLQPAQRAELRSIIAAIQARNINMQADRQEAQAMVTPREFMRLLQLLGFENPAQTLRSYVQQYGYGMYDDLLAQLFEMLHYAKPIETPTLYTPLLQIVQTDWTWALGKAALCLVMLARQLAASKQVVRSYMMQAPAP